MKYIHSFILLDWTDEIGIVIFSSLKAQARQLSLESRKLDIFVENSSFYNADFAWESMNEVQCLNLKKILIMSIIIRSARKGGSRWFCLLIPLHQVIHTFECPEYRGLQPHRKLRNLHDTIALKMGKESFSRKCEAESGHITYLNDLGLWLFRHAER